MHCLASVCRTSFGICANKRITSVILNPNVWRTFPNANLLRLQCSPTTPYTHLVFINYPSSLRSLVEGMHGTRSSYPHTYRILSVSQTVIIVIIAGSVTANHRQVECDDGIMGKSGPSQWNGWMPATWWNRFIRGHWTQLLLFVKLLIIIKLMPPLTEWVLLLGVYVILSLQ